MSECGKRDIAHIMVTHDGAFHENTWKCCTCQFSRCSKKLACNWWFKEGMSESQNLTDTVHTYVLLSGSTHILTPRKLLEEVKSLSKPKDMVCIKDE